jgi:hypothetical protein
MRLAVRGNDFIDIFIFFDVEYIVNERVVILFNLFVIGGMIFVIFEHY